MGPGVPSFRSHSSKLAPERDGAAFNEDCPEVTWKIFPKRGVAVPLNPAPIDYSREVVKTI
jgi:hypothetical protein